MVKAKALQQVDEYPSLFDQMDDNVDEVVELPEDHPTANAFGGPWTEEKLDVLREYLAFYVQVFKNQPWAKLAYIDTFAGTGRCLIRDGRGHRTIHGSARLALDTPGFAQYNFIETAPEHLKELDALVASHPNGNRVKIYRQSAADLMPSMLTGFDWRKWRGVLFLDPYGLQCTWPMLEQIASTKALDVFFLLSLSGLFRNAARDVADVDEGKAAILTSVLGTDDWRNVIYTRDQLGLFGGSQLTRAAGWRAILDFTTTRLRTIFPHVAEPKILAGQKGPAKFALYFMVANDRERALKLASKVSNGILKKLR